MSTEYRLRVAAGQAVRLDDRDGELTVLDGRVWLTLKHADEGPFPGARRAYPPARGPWRSGRTGQPPSGGHPEVAAAPVAGGALRGRGPALARARLRFAGAPCVGPRRSAALSMNRAPAPIETGLLAIKIRANSRQAASNLLADAG